MYTPKERRRLECPICQVRLTSQEHLANHCRLYHDDEACVVEERSFNNHMEFEVWKEETEKKFLTFWQLAGKSDHGRHHITYYKCYRCRRQAVDKKRLITPSCTSFMRKHVDFAKNSGGILVKFCTRHINHDVSAASLPLSKSDRNVITQYLRKGLSTKAIRKQLHELYTDPSVRLHYISSSDIRKVRASLQPSSQVRKFEGFSSPFSRMKVTSKRNHSDVPIPATSLLEESSTYVKDEDGGKGSAVSEVRNEVSSPVEASAHVEIPLLCPSCVKLSERMAQLESVVDKINERLKEIEGSKPFTDSIKEEQL